MENFVKNISRLPDLFILSCKWYWSKSSFIWGAIILNIVLSFISILLFTNSSNLAELPIGWLIHNPLPVLIAFLCVLTLTVISWIVSELPAIVSASLHEYLRMVLQQTEQISLSGIPGGLIAESVRLDEVFIPLQLRFNRSRTDYPLTDKELKRYQQHFKNETTSRNSNNLERVLFEAEKNWQEVLREGDRISIDEMWEQMTPDHPAAIIQGYPGIGKSTLMNRLVLHMARISLRLPDPTMPGGERIKPPLIPILMSLNMYAAANNRAELSLDSYLLTVLADIGVHDARDAIRQKLLEGRCLVIFDGLDEVNDPNQREKVQNAIRAFIRSHRTAPRSAYFNRFLITSRVAGYDLATFPDFTHFTIAELTDEQIDDFLPRWGRSNLLSLPTPSSALSLYQTTAFSREVEQKAQQLAIALKRNAALRELAENPLLLTLIVVMQQNSIVLPQQRVELYNVVTRTLLENRNIAKNLTPIPESQAIQYLGPLAFAMQAEGNSLTRERDVLASLCNTISTRSDTAQPDEIEHEAKAFLIRVRERGGLFVERTSGYFGFIHRTFQDYFAARHMLTFLETDRQKGIAELVKLARRHDDLWREPFLLAIAYQSGKNEKVADAIITALLDTVDRPFPAPSYQEEREQYEHDLLLAAECLIEAKPLSIDATLEKDIAHRLLQAYEQGQYKEQFGVRDKIENVIRRSLLSLPKEAYRSPLLIELHTAVSDTNTIFQQRTTLTLLAMIAQQLADCPNVVFETLIPPLLALISQPAIGSYKPDVATVASSSLDVADLALTVLSFLGKSGPSGLLLTEVRQYFANNPEHLRLLALYSLECGTLITPVIVPLQQENYRRYKAAIGQWIKLRDTSTAARITKQDINLCLAIQQTLLECGEEVSYPATLQLLSMVGKTELFPKQNWQNSWLTFLMDQLNLAPYLYYQVSVFLWIMLFPSEQELYRLAMIIFRHYGNIKDPAHIYARRFLLNLCIDLNEHENLRTLRDLRDIEHLRIFRTSQDLQDLDYLRQLKTAPTSSGKGYSETIQRLKKILFTRLLTEETLSNLRVVDKPARTELLTILKERVLQISEQKDVKKDIADEVQAIIGATSRLKDAQEVYEAAIAITKLLTIRSEGSTLIQLQPPSIREQDIQEIRSAIGNKTFQHYTQLAEAIIRRMGIVDSIEIKSSNFPSGTVWEIMLPDIGLQIKTNKSLLFLRQKNILPMAYAELTELAGNSTLIFIVDIADIPYSLFQRGPRTIWFSPQSLLEMITTSNDELVGWLGRFITTKLERTVREALLPYRTDGTAGKSFVGRDNELTRLTLADQYGGIILGAHRSGKSSLMDQLGKKLHSEGHNVIGRFDIGGAGFQTFFERTLNHLDIVPTKDMSPESWAAVLRKQTDSKSKPIFLLDEVDGLLELDEQSDFILGRQMRSLQQEGHCNFYLAGHKKLREASLLEYGPFQNFASKVTLTGIEEGDANFLIQAPMQRIGFKLNNEQIQRIFTGTAGVPFLIQDFCTRLLCSLSPDQISVPEVEDSAFDEIEQSPDYLETVFRYYKYAQEWDSLCVMLIVALAGKTTKQGIMNELDCKGSFLTQSRLDEILSFLCEFGVIEILPDKNYSIQARYLQQAILAREPEPLLASLLKQRK